MTSTRVIDQHRTVLASAREVLETMAGDLHGVFNDELAELLTEVDSLVAMASGVRSEVVLESKARGVMTETGQNTREWIIAYAPSLRQAGAGQLAKLVDTVYKRTGIPAGCDYDDYSHGFNRNSPIALIWEAARCGDIEAPLGMTILNEMNRLEDRIMREAIAPATEAMIESGAQHGPTGVRDLRMRIIAEWGTPDGAEKEQRPLGKHAFLSAPKTESGDLTRYSMALTPEQSAVLEAALGPFAKPRPNPESGDPDLRSNGQRRAEGLIDLCRLMASADAERRGGPAQSDTCVFVNIDLEDLVGESGAGEAAASSSDGTIINTTTLRRMCCDADIIPVLRGVDGEILDFGMTVRLFTRAQRRALWVRDRGCTFPGCTAPGAWTKVHHVRHWADGGPTDLSNAALLCQRHHTHVHGKRLWAEVLEKPDDAGRYVVWDLVPGSYDRASLEQGWARGWHTAS